MKSNIIEFTVSQLSNRIKALIEDNVGYVRVVGEIGGLKKAASGHVYFSLKENSDVLSSVCFRGKMAMVNFPIEDGMKIAALGKVTTYGGRSNYQIIIDKIELAGIGELIKEIELRKQKLLKEGLFDKIHKKPLPFWPGKIGIITSSTGAVIQDMQSRLQSRFPSHVLLYPATTQGVNAVVEIIAGLNFLQNLPDSKKPDVIIIARGGGSFEDLLPFNDEVLVREVFAAKIPIVSAIGHETDTTIIDFVSDVRAETPTAAIEIITPILGELQKRVIDLDHQIDGGLRTVLIQKFQLLESLDQLITHPKNILQNKQEKLASIMQYLQSILEFYLRNKENNLIGLGNNILATSFSTAEKEQKIISLFDKISLAIKNNFQQKTDELEFIEKLLQSYDYYSVLKRGYSLIRDQEFKIIKSVEDLLSDKELLVEMGDGVKKIRVGLH
ncbi:exodeoxyribonuclease VII large subunit [Flavobacteriaceae bacterium]|nr:exodeoxyribonuclease VII large subunit [Flavobacteriaceae bacterium]